MEVGVPALRSDRLALTPPPLIPPHKEEGNRSRSVLADAPRPYPALKAV